MFHHLVKKELLHYLLDLRFIVVFGLCILLSALGVYVGSRSYLQHLEEYQAVDRKNRNTLRTALENNNLSSLKRSEYRWNRRPEILSPVVYGLSGKLGRETRMAYRRHIQFEASRFATDPVHALFGVLDLAFIVKIVLSLCVLLFTYDAVCGEKETGTLKLYASFPVSRSTLALSKLAGSAVAVLIPFVLAFLLSSVVLALSPGLGLQAEDGVRLALLMGSFALYLTVFAGFGVLVSALTHRRITAFLGLLGLWAVWLFVIPNLAVDTARRLVPVTSIYDMERQHGALREEIRKQRGPEIDAYWKRNFEWDLEKWNAMPETRQRELLEGASKIQHKWDTEFHARQTVLQTVRHNQMRKRQALAHALSAVSPLGAVTFVSMDLARTGPVQQERVEDAVKAYIGYLVEYIRKKDAQPWDKRSLTDFSLFTYTDTEPVGDSLSRSLFHILNLALLAILGFAGAYVAILRYDVR